MKWFIVPAEPREIIEKSEEIRKGVKQLLALQKALQDTPERIYQALGVDNSFEIYFAVVSENYIGTVADQHPDVPVIQRKHLTKDINTTGNLTKVIDWLMQRKYLPVKDVHFKFRERTFKIGPWALQWYELEPTITEPWL